MMPHTLPLSAEEQVLAKDEGIGPLIDVLMMRKRKYRREGGLLRVGFDLIAFSSLYILGIFPS